MFTERDDNNNERGEFEAREYVHNLVSFLYPWCKLSRIGLDGNNIDS